MAKKRSKRDTNKLGAVRAAHSYVKNSLMPELDILTGLAELAELWDKDGNRELSRQYAQKFAKRLRRLPRRATTAIGKLKSAA